MLNKYLKYGGAIVLLLLFIGFIGYSCPIQKITGFPCPGCNIITSAYWLFIKGNLNVSFYYHALLIPTICIFIICIVLTCFQKDNIRNYILILWAILMIIFYVFRMITVFPNAPMYYDEHSLFYMIYSLFV